MKKLSGALFLILALFVFLPVPIFAGAYSGLWVGQVEVNKVNEAANKIDANTVKDVKNPFDLRLLLHADAADQVRMLRDVTVMQKRYTVEANGQKQEMVRRVLITDDTLLSQFEGVVRRDGKLTGIRMGSAGIDFETDKNELPMTGAIAPSKTAAAALNLSKTHPANPFRHKFHPEHQNDGNNGIEVKRDITLTFDPIPQNAIPKDGVSKLKGKYQETITGLHKAPIKLEGTFSIERVSVIDKLNDK